MDRATEEIIAQHIENGNLILVSKQNYFELVDNMIAYTEMTEEDLKGYYPPSKNDVGLIEKANLIYTLLFELEYDNRLRNYDMNSDEQARTQWDLVNMLRDMSKDERNSMIKNYLAHFSSESVEDVWSYVQIKQEWNKFGLSRIKDAYKDNGENIYVNTHFVYSKRD